LNIIRVDVLGGRVDVVGGDRLFSGTANILRQRFRSSCFALCIILNTNVIPRNNTKWHDFRPQTFNLSFCSHTESTRNCRTANSSITHKRHY